LNTRRGQEDPEDKVADTQFCSKLLAILALRTKYLKKGAHILHKTPYNKPEQSNQGHWCLCHTSSVSSRRRRRGTRACFSGTLFRRMAAVHHHVAGNKSLHSMAASSTRDGVDAWPVHQRLKVRRPDGLGFHTTRKKAVDVLGSRVASLFWCAACTIRGAPKKKVGHYCTHARGT
jgi:hypothetical protein